MIRIAAMDPLAEPASRGRRPTPHAAVCFALAAAVYLTLAVVRPHLSPPRAARSERAGRALEGSGGALAQEERTRALLPIAIGPGASRAASSPG
jgi:hypothetical protein